MDESLGGEQRSAAHPGAARWLSVHDDLLRGLTHTLSNRVGTISALAYMVDLQPESLGSTAATLRAESERLEGVLQLLRLLPRRLEAAAEPVVPTDAVSQAIALHAHHAGLREIPITVTIDGDLQPAYAEPSALVMAVAVLIGSAQRAIGGTGAIELTISSTTDVVRISTRGQHADGPEAPLDDDATLDADADAVSWLLASSGGSGAREPAGGSLIVPTLQAARRARRS